MNNLWLIVLGSALATIGGWVSYEIRAWRERKRELNSIKVTIGDELTEITDTINTMHEVWRAATVIPSAADLLENTTAFDNLRNRLFLIENKVLRKKIVAFYKKLKDTVKKSDGKLGSLANTEEARAEQGRFDAEFQTLGTEAERIGKELGQ